MGTNPKLENPAQTVNRVNLQKRVFHVHIAFMVDLSTVCHIEKVYLSVL